MPPKRYIPVNPAPAKFHCEDIGPNGWIVCEGKQVIAITPNQAYAAAIANCLNICVALFAHLPIKLAGTHTDSVN